MTSPSWQNSQPPSRSTRRRLRLRQDFEDSEVAAQLESIEAQVQRPTRSPLQSLAGTRLEPRTGASDASYLHAQRPGSLVANARPPSAFVISRDPATGAVPIDANAPLRRPKRVVTPTRPSWHRTATLVAAGVGAAAFLWGAAIVLADLAWGLTGN
ncbi:hypothetical protein [Xylophilus sp. GOD-11R]|uniref:hypothetical protein n=1 Tax=Xylophilus sp. GOD-11R TaxID=3089814 RepID=UPI00298C4E23|nr:hypothetical protein [Xylophilus sp. GOD-11R]WPB58987.1 hypothetical protein R9X41_10255 [Xylophilus sp. GOD-11R]